MSGGWPRQSGRNLVRLAEGRALGITSITGWWKRRGTTSITSSDSRGQTRPASSLQSMKEAGGREEASETETCAFALVI